MLLAEDDPDTRAVAVAALRRGGCEVRAVENGRAALAAARECVPAVILLDWYMPELDGPDTCAAFKGDPATAGIPVVFLTSKTDPESRERARALGALGCLPKPFNPGTLSADLLALLESGA